MSAHVIGKLILTLNKKKKTPATKKLSLSNSWIAKNGCIVVIKALLEGAAVKFFVTCGDLCRVNMRKNVTY
ncbi:hypothetical protein A1OQ_14425 [Enterovibrio norvegicus FF-162]|nr:hypothetical protein A1OQ_14425 [Enterovibrio norvegicus FF-162]